MICVDANVAVKWILAQEHSDKALALMAACAQQRQRIVSPPLLPIEVASVLRRLMVSGPPADRLTLPQAGTLITTFLAFPITLAAPAGLYHAALSIAEAHNLPAVYDAHYVALAQLLGCDLWTDDRRLLRTLGGRLAFVKWIGDYTEGQPLS